MLATRPQGGVLVAVSAFYLLEAQIRWCTGGSIGKEWFGNRVKPAEEQRCDGGQ